MKSRRLLLLLTVLLAVIVPTLASGLDRASRPRMNLDRRPLTDEQNITGDVMRSATQSSYVEGEVLVKFKPEKIDLAKQRDKYQLVSFYFTRGVGEKTRLTPQNVTLLTSRIKTTAALMRQFQNDPAVEYVEPNYIQYLQATPNDVEYSKLWGMNNTGQTVNSVVGTADADIDAPEAWGSGWGVNPPNGSAVTVAVIDSGVATGHPDLAGNLVAG